ncbi:hypothetical protein SAMN04487949_0961 [Halogranum gelatinilyticum]|uniref:Uncharacterized protein n=1 Tax=Halogranum gelatinilyticum TaxID=660521 RepID=A0A1G9QP65_9EURY|nr:hypothetical protein [Halogranum gelatinilyticum]SDM12788.1 hypothetical protein SAMN04487949_0961 [Halogranum gelatinilyticum]
MTDGRLLGSETALFGVVVPVALGLVTTALLVLDGRAALAAGLVAGLTLVAIGAVLALRRGE